MQVPVPCGVKLDLANCHTVTTRATPYTLLVEGETVRLMVSISTLPKGGILQKSHLLPQ